MANSSGITVDSTPWSKVNFISSLGVLQHNQISHSVPPFVWIKRKDFPSKLYTIRTISRQVLYWCFLFPLPPWHPWKGLWQRGEKKAGFEVHPDCTRPIEDGITDAANSEQFLQERSKVNGKAGNLGRRAAAIKWNKSKITVAPEVPFSKKYLKYLTKKILEEQSLRLLACCHWQPRELLALLPD